MEVITRIPPSPTGYLHVGTVRTALFNYLFARHHGGKVYLRLEDTDRERSSSEFETDIKEGLHWIGIEHDNEHPMRQSERIDIYRSYLKKLIEKGSAYEAEDSEKGEGKVVRFKNPNIDITFHDEIRGDITFNTSELEDFVIAKNVSEPLYHLAVVVDDAEMGVTHVIRGEDLISSTPRQILILEALGFVRPIYAHVPLVLAPDRSKLSKRHGAISLNEYRERGYLPDAMRNFLVLLGWHPKDDKEVLSLQEMIDAFDLNDIQKGGAIFDIEKLNWMNKEYIKAMSDSHIIDMLFRETSSTLLRGHHRNTLELLVPIVKERATTLADIRTLATTGELMWAFERPSYAPEALLGRMGEGSAQTPEEASKHLRATTEKLQVLSENDFVKESIKTVLWDYATAEGRGNVLWPMRFALTGREKSPDPFTVAAILGKIETIARLESAARALANE